MVPLCVRLLVGRLQRVGRGELNINIERRKKDEKGEIQTE
jgi:hypothetical protein